jgi:hypothetical protein
MSEPPSRLGVQSRGAIDGDTGRVVLINAPPAIPAKWTAARRRPFESAADLTALVGRFNCADDGTAVIPSTYAEGVITKAR